MPSWIGSTVHKQHLRKYVLALLMITMMLVNTACAGIFGREINQAPSGIDLLPVPPLRAGINDWQLWLQPGSKFAGVNQVNMVNDETYGRVVEFTRSADESGDGGAAGITQSLDINAQAYPHLYLWVVGRVLQEEGGNLANHNPRWFPEGAIQVRIAYLTMQGEGVEWYHGFYYSRVDGADKDNFSQVKQGQWFAYLSPDLRSLDPPPSRIVEIRLYGFGWRFQGQTADIRLIGTNQKAQ